MLITLNLKYGRGRQREDQSNEIGEDTNMFLLALKEEEAAYRIWKRGGNRVSPGASRKDGSPVTP